MKAPPRSGFVCLAGAPNVGKSTLLNRLVGTSVSITAPKPQTTRNRIFGIKTTAEYQLIFVDTPGIHQPSQPLNRRMVGYARQALQDADMTLLLTPPLNGPDFAPPPELSHVLKLVRQGAGKVLLAINKIDLVGARQVLETIRWADGIGCFTHILPVSALSGRGVAELEQVLAAELELGPCYFEPEHITDQSEQMLVAEGVRQEVFRRTHQEIPYSSAVRVLRMERQPERLSITAEILLERDSQKGIVIGKGGRMLKAIGSAARRRLEGLLGVHIFLELRVRVLKDWSANALHLNELGYPES